MATSDKFAIQNIIDLVDASYERWRLEKKVFSTKLLPLWSNIHKYHKYHKEW